MCARLPGSVCVCVGGKRTTEEVRDPVRKKEKILTIPLDSNYKSQIQVSLQSRDPTAVLSGVIIN